MCALQSIPKGQLQLKWNGYDSSRTDLGEYNNTITHSHGNTWKNLALREPPACQAYCQQPAHTPHSKPYSFAINAADLWFLFTLHKLILSQTSPLTAKEVGHISFICQSAT